jgi:hypothetical protein
VSDCPEIMESEGLTDHAHAGSTQCPRCGVPSTKGCRILSNGGAIELPWVNRPQAISADIVGSSR